MIKLDFAKNKTYYVVGLGKSNRAVIKALKKADADIRVWDDNGDALSNFDDKMITPPDKAPWSKIKSVIVAPGIAPTHPIVETARDKDIPVLCDIDLYCQSNPQTKLIAVTGTNGKSTTVALINHILSADGSSQMGGNIGVPVMDLKAKSKYTVLELSSYQLEYSPNLSTDISVLLNMSPDHLAWHGDMASYIAAKSKIFDKAEIQIISVDDDTSKNIAGNFEAPILLSVYDDDLPFNPSDFPRLKGQHNVQNMLAAYNACKALGLSDELIIEQMKSFEGLNHRQYLVRVINGVPYINDSKATNAEASKMALNAYRNIIWIAGGQAKDGGIEDLANHLSSVQTAYLYGECRDEFAKVLQAQGVETHVFITMDEAFAQAHEMAQSLRGEPSGAPTLLFSPAAASFDQFKNFEERGDYFTNLVNTIESD